MNLERRILTATAELRAVEPADGGKPRALVGYAAVFNSLSADLGGFRERILPGAFKQSLASGADIRALVNHDATQILGRTGAGTLALAEDRNGLRAEIELPDTSYARDLWASVKRGDVAGMSFGFRVFPDGEAWTRDAATVIRELSNVDLREVTFTSVPAYPATDVSVRVDPAAVARAGTMAGRELASRWARILKLRATA